MGATGIVTSVGSRSVQVWVEGKGELRCTLRGGIWDERREETKPVAVGDRVSVHVEGEGGAIEGVEPRRTRLARARGGRTHVVAANIDRLVIVASLADPPFRPGLVDRYLVAAAAEGLEPVLVLNKVDLDGDRDVVAPYRDLDVKTLETSATTGEGVHALAAEMSAGISLLVGHSGTGKSSLLNAISPGLALQTGDVASYHGRGRHTTTSSRLVRLDGGGFVVDSPGIREFGLEGVDPADAARLFPGFADLADDCRFGDCLHRNEPRCAVRAAVEAGELPKERYESWLRLLADVAGE